MVDFFKKYVYTDPKYKEQVYKERVKNLYDSDYGRELTDGLTYYERKNLLGQILNFDFYDLERKEQFYNSLSHHEKEIYRKMLYANIDHEVIEFLLSEPKKKKLKYLINRFYDKEKSRCVMI